MFLSEWHEFPLAPCLTGGEKEKERKKGGEEKGGETNLITARVWMLLKSRMLPDMLPFSLCNKKRLAIQHINRSLFPTTLSIPSYDIGK